MKKILISILMTMMILPTGVYAQETEPYYTNINGATLTEVQYTRLREVFSEDTIYTMTVDAINLLKDETQFRTTEEVKYIRIDDYYDRSGNYIDTIETEVTEKEALNFSDNNQTSTYAWNVTHQTSMKKLYMQVVLSGVGESQKTVTLTNTWLSLPSTRSYDVIALRPGQNSLTVNVNSSTISGYQKWDGNYINYSANSDNTKISTVFDGNGGIGISMNIKDDVTTSLENSLSVTFASGSNPFKIYGTYQHAQSSVTLSESQNYSFSSAGLGKVLAFNSSSIESKYDRMSGVYLSYEVGEELYG